MTIQAVGATYTGAFEQKNKAIKSIEAYFPVKNIAEKHEENPPINYEELAQQYDVRNATFEEIKEISNALYQAGEISMKEHMILTFDFGRATADIRRNAPGYVSTDFDMYKTPANENGQRDWIAEIKARAADHFKYGNIIGYETNSKILAVLQKMERA